MANTSELLKEINDRLNKIVDAYDPDDASAALTHILNTCATIATGISYASVYKISDDLIECAIELEPTSEITFDDDDFWRHARTKKTDETSEQETSKDKCDCTGDQIDRLKNMLKDESRELCRRIGDVSERVNSIDAEVEAIKEHLTDHGLGINSTFNCDEILKRLNEKNEAAKKAEAEAAKKKRR